MTVISKSTIVIKKVPLIDEERGDDELIDPQTFIQTRRPSMCAMICMVITVIFLLLMGVLTAMQILEQLAYDAAQRNRFMGYCSIPLPKDTQALEARKMPLQWTTTQNDHAEPEVQVVNLLDDDPEHLLDLLREVLDIDIDDSVEKISVFNNGHPVSFIHDFESNVTGIVDEERCFIMDLDPEIVLQPELFVFGLQRGDEFDVTRVRSSLRAALPALPPAHAHRAHCGGKPTYRLQKDTDVVIRKRSADAPPHDYMQFAGKRIQEIEISNLAELLEYEQNKKQSA